MHANVSIRINSEAKENLDKIKKREVFSTFSDAISTMCKFFEKNNISPKDGIIESYQNSLYVGELTPFGCCIFIPGAKNLLQE